MIISENDQISLKVLELKQEHQDLHYFIELISQQAYPDQVRLKRLKKRKLVVKDQLEQLGSSLIPDLDA